MSSQWVVIMLLSVALSGCVPGLSPSAGGVSEGAVQPDRPLASRVLVVLMPDEPAAIAAKPARDIRGTSFEDSKGFFNAGLAIVDG